MPDPSSTGATVSAAGRGSRPRGSGSRSKPPPSTITRVNPRDARERAAAPARSRQPPPATGARGKPHHLRRAQPIRPGHVLRAGEHRRRPAFGEDAPVRAEPALRVEHHPHRARPPALARGERADRPAAPCPRRPRPRGRAPAAGACAGCRPARRSTARSRTGWRCARRGSAPAGPPPRSHRPRTAGASKGAKSEASNPETGPSDGAPPASRRASNASHSIPARNRSIRRRSLPQARARALPHRAA